MVIFELSKIEERLVNEHMPTWAPERVIADGIIRLIKAGEEHKINRAEYEVVIGAPAYYSRKQKEWTGRRPFAV